MVICCILMIAIVVISLICIKTIKNINEKDHIKAVFPKHLKWMSVAFAGFFYLFIGINFSYIESIEENLISLQ